MEDTDATARHLREVDKDFSLEGFKRGSGEGGLDEGGEGEAEEGEDQRRGHHGPKG